MLKIYFLIKNDFKINSFISAITLLIYRVENYIYYKYKNYTLMKLLKISTYPLRMIFGLNSQIAYEAIIGENIRLPHRAFGVIISSKAIIKNNVTIFHQVTLGINDRNEKNQKIIIGNNTYLSTGCKIISSKVGDNVIVAPNTIVYKDVEDNMFVYTGSLVCEKKIIKREKNA